MPILYAVVLLLLSVNILLGFPKAIELIQAKTNNESLVASSIISQSQIKGVRLVKMPHSLGAPPPIVSATAVWVGDLGSGQILYIKDPHKKVPVASTTKIMTALLAAAYFSSDQVLTVPSIIQANGSSMGLVAGEKLTVRNLLFGMLLNSGNDAAFTLADNFPGGVGGFVAEMNNQVLQMGLTDTHFDNPAGFDSPYHYSSAADMAKITMKALENPYLSRIFATKEATVFSVDGNTHYLKNLNKLLEDPTVLGVKTGTTPQAKENLIGLIDKDGHKILTVVLGSNDRFRETRELTDWVSANFEWR